MIADLQIQLDSLAKVLHVAMERGNKDNQIIMGQLDAIKKMIGG